MLANAGIAVDCAAPGVEEHSLKSGEAQVDALRLAVAKALAVSERFPEAWTIGGDSIVTVEGRTFDKPGDRDEAAEHLRFFSGKTMILTSAVALARGGQVDWSIADFATLKVRTLGDHFITEYLAAEWPDIGYCVGVFRMEGRGVTLFESIGGSHFTILGMPLLPLLGALRARGLIES
jgi:septum formation protein